jgi:hypothetical protein
VLLASELQRECDPSFERGRRSERCCPGRSAHPHCGSARRVLPRRAVWRQRRTRGPDHYLLRSGKSPPLVPLFQRRVLNSELAVLQGRCARSARLRPLLARALLRRLPHNPRFKSSWDRGLDYPPQVELLPVWRGRPPRSGRSRLPHRRPERPPCLWRARHHPSATPRPQCVTLLLRSARLPPPQPLDHLRRRRLPRPLSPSHERAAPSVALSGRQRCSSRYRQVAH